MTASARSRRPRVGLLWSQFSAYHIDRCEAVAARLEGRADVLAVEVASASTNYAWDASGAVRGARKRTLFPGEQHDRIPILRRFRRQFAALRGCDVVYVGISYAERDIILLSFALRLTGTRMILMTESKFDDFQRRLEKELVKVLVFAPYAAALVGGRRQTDYMRFIAFRRRQVVTGYDAVNLDRVRAMGAHPPAPAGPAFADRPFVFVGRFVPKKSVPFLLDAYARYLTLGEGPAHRLLLVGGGEEEAEARAQADRLGIAQHVDFAGFLQAEGVARALSGGLALVLPSIEEQWGLVVNEALAFHLPVIVSENVGSRDLLVRNLVNGFVIEHGSVEGLARAMAALGGDEALWRRMVAASAELAPLAHSDRFAEAVEALLPG